MYANVPSAAIVKSLAARIVPMSITTMLRLKSEQRRALSDTLRELANLVAAALILSQLVGQQHASFGPIVGGIVAWFVLVGFALRLEGGN
jgi:hypothetical protein